MEIYKLRCTNCGAPLPVPKPGDNWVKCEYCGYANRIIEATHYVEELKRELEKWIKEILPPAVITSTTIDVAARYQIFQSLIKPKVNLIRANIRAKYLQQISQPIIPFISQTPPLSEDSKHYFEEALKVESLRDFAISEEDQRLLVETLVYEYLTAYVVNVFRALSKGDSKTAIKNCEEALRVIPDTQDYVLIKERLRAIHSTLSAVNELLNRNTQAALTLINNSIELYKSLLQKVLSRVVPEVNPGILEVEKMCSEVLANIIESAHRLFTAGEDPLRVLVWFEKYIGLFNKVRETYKRPIQDLLEISKYVKEIVYSKTGFSEISVVSGSGVYYIPHYVVEVRFSYVKGFLFKKGAESALKLVVIGITPLTEGGVFDVLGVSAGKPVPPDRVEEAPALKVISEILSRSTKTYIPLRARAIPPIISSILAEKIADSYIANANNYYRGKITFASTSVRELIYVPFTQIDNKTLDFEGKLRIRLNIDLSSLEPLTI